jgi:prepilin-type N-terminal cleavage/methylation domain-containing protein
MTSHANNSTSNNTRRLRARGLTLVELLVVIAILSLVTVATIPLMQPPTGDRKVREAARSVATTFELARARATETGRPAGVWIEPQQAPVNGAIESYKLFLCDVPPPYAGDDTSSGARTNTSDPTAATTTSVNLSGAGSLTNLCKYGDRIRFNYRGPYYKIVGGTDGQSLTGTSFAIAVNSAPDFNPPPPNIPNTAPGVPFEIIRQPIKSSINPTILATNAPASVVDLSQSGMGNAGHGADAFGHGSNGRPVVVTFTPAGAVHQVQHYDGNDMEIDHPTAMIYFLVRLRKEEGLVENGVAYQTTTAYKDFSAFWIGINPTTGLVSVASVYSSSSSPPSDRTESRRAATLGNIEGGL